MTAPMSIIFASVALMLSAPGVSSGFDQTRDARLVLSFVDAVRRGAFSEAQAMLTPGAFVGDYAQKRATTFVGFADYARACGLSQINVVSWVSARRMPIRVKWRCSSTEGERDAAFWFEGEKISRIGWGRPAVVEAVPPGGRD